MLLFTMKWMISPARLHACTPARLLACTSAMLMLSEPAFSEPAIFTPPVWDIAEDTDQDGLRDVDELLMFGLDPLDSIDGLSDDDGDLLSMACEIYYETSPDLADTDGDTWTDSEELLFYGTNPLDPLSFPQEIGENDQKTTETPSPSTTFVSQPPAALVQTPPPLSLSNGEFDELIVTNFRHHTGADYQGKVFDWGSGAGDANGWTAYKGSMIEVWKSGDERFIELDGWSGHYGVKQPIANVAPGSHVLYWQQTGRTNPSAGDNAYKVQVYYLKSNTEVKVAETGNIANIDKTKWTPNALGFTITAEQIADANGSSFYVAFIPTNNNTYGTLIDKVGLATVEIIIPKLDTSGLQIDGEFVYASELKVAKWETAFQGGINDGSLKDDFISWDKDRFYINIIGGSLAGADSVIIATEDCSDSSYNDNPTPITLLSDGPNAITNSIILVSNDDDDDYDGKGAGVDDQLDDRSHKIQLGGSLTIKSIRISGEIYNINIKLPVIIRKKLLIDCIRMNVDGVHSVNQIQENIKLMNEMCAQVGLVIKATIKEMPWPSISSRDQGYLELYNKPQNSLVGPLTDEYKRFIDEVDSQGTNIYYLLAAYPSLGIAITPKQILRETSELDAKYLDKAFVNSLLVKNLGDTPIHELLHLLAYRTDGLHDHHEPYWNLLNVTNSNQHPVLWSKRINSEQQSRIDQHPNIQDAK